MSLLADGGFSFLAGLRAATLSGVLFATAAASAAQSTEWINPFLGPQHARWLVGALSEIATEQERQEFLLLDNDAAAERFIADFWSKPGRPELRDIYDRRLAEAESRFAEGTRGGGRSDRGAIYVLYGEPAEIQYEEFRDIQDPDVEVWRYEKKAEVGLDGEKPKRTYRFVKVGDTTRRFEKGDRNDPVTQRRRQPRSLLPPFP